VLVKITEIRREALGQRHRHYDERPYALKAAAALEYRRVDVEEGFGAQAKGFRSPLRTGSAYLRNGRTRQPVPSSPSRQRCSIRMGPLRRPPPNSAKLSIVTCSLARCSMTVKSPRVLRLAGVVATDRHALLTRYRTRVVLSISQSPLLRSLKPDVISSDSRQ
jgi:hypothetical protein